MAGQLCHLLKALSDNVNYSVKIQVVKAGNFQVSETSPYRLFIKALGLGVIWRSPLNSSLEKETESVQAPG